MTIYYVRKTGSDANNGLSAATAKATIAAAEALVAAGDTVYIGPGWYAEIWTPTTSGTLGNLITFIADVKGEYTLETPGRVIVTGRTVTGTTYEAQTTATLTISGLTFRRFEYFIILGGAASAVLSPSTYTTPQSLEQVQFYGCSFVIHKPAVTSYGLAVAFNEGVTPGTSGLRLDHCTIFGSTYISYKSNAVAEVNLKIVMNRCVLMGMTRGVDALYITRSGSATTPNYTAGGYKIINCLFISGNYSVEIGPSNYPVTATHNLLLQNCIFSGGDMGAVTGESDNSAYMQVKNCWIWGGSDTTSNTSPELYSYSYDHLLSGFHDFAVSKLLEDAGYKIAPFSLISRPDETLHYGAQANDTNVTLDLYGEQNNYPRCKIIRFAGTVSTPGSYWTQGDRIGDTSYFNYSFGSTTGSETTGYLEVAGTQSLSGVDLGTITSVYVRLTITNAQTHTLGYKFYTQNRAETLASGSVPITANADVTNRITHNVPLSTPTGGWSANVLENLVVRMWKATSGTGSVSVAMAEVVILCSGGSKYMLGPVSAVTPSKAVEITPAMSERPAMIGPLSNPPSIFASGSLYANNLNTANAGIGGQLTFRKAGTITHVGVYCRSVTGNPPSYKIGLYTNTNGTPNATTPYGGSTDTTYDFTVAGWHWIPLPTPAIAQFGDLASVLIFPGSTPPDTSNMAQISIGLGAATGITRYGRRHTSSNGGSTWSGSGNAGPFAARYSDGTIAGLAFGSDVTGVSVTSASNPNEYGCYFVLEDTVTVSSFRLQDGLSIMSTGMAVVTLYDESNTVLRSYTITDNDIFYSGDEIDIPIESVALLAGTGYRLAIRPTGTGSGGTIAISSLIFESWQAKAVWPGSKGFDLTYRNYSNNTGTWTNEPRGFMFVGLLVDSISRSEVVMASIFEGLPLNAEIMGANCAELATTASGRFVLAFDDTAAEYADWTRKIPPSTLGSAITLYISYSMASATSGTLAFKAEVEKITPGQAIDINAGHAFDTANLGSMTVPAVAGYPQELAIPLTYRASMAEGDVITLRITRDVANDSCAGDCYVTAIEVRNT